MLRSCLVSGGSTGLGRGLVNSLSRKGCKVAYFGRHEGEPNTDPNIKYIKCDITDHGGVKEAALKAADFFGGEIRAVVNCAAVYTSKRIFNPKSGAVFPYEEIKQMVDVNVMGTLNVCSHTAALMAKNLPDDNEERGVIINTASIAALEGQVGQSVYGACKGAMVSSTLPIARDLKDLGIRCNTICPGVFRAGLFYQLTSTMQENLANDVPNPRRLGYPEEFASLVEHLILNNYINGETIRIDGALRLS